MKNLLGFFLCFLVLSNVGARNTAPRKSQGSTEFIASERRDRRIRMYESAKSVHRMEGRMNAVGR